MNIRPEQMTQLAQAAERDFQQRMGSHLREFFPEQYAGLGEAAVREAVQEAIQKARSYQILAERDICKYADVMSAFGRDFDRNAALGWASSILNDPALRDAGARVNRLADEALGRARALEAEGRNLLGQAQGALAATGKQLAASAAALGKALTDAAQNFGNKPVGAIVEGCKQTAAKADDLCMGKGFADPAQIEGFVKDFKSQVADNWDNLKPEERFEAVKKLQEKQFRDLGIPVPTISRSVDAAAGWDDPPTLFGMADAAGWGMVFNGHLFEKSPLSEFDQKELAKTMMHEGRHIEQYFKAAQFRAAEGATAEAMRTLESATHKAMNIPAEVAEQAAKNPLPQVAQALGSHLPQAEQAAKDAASQAEGAVKGAAAQLEQAAAQAQGAVSDAAAQAGQAAGAPCDNYQKAKEWFDAKYGKGPLSQYSLPYKDRPLEKDAFALEKIIDDKW